MAEKGNLTPEQRQAYWKKTSTLMWTIMFLWLIFSFVIHIWAPSLNKIRFIGFPLGFYMAAQGSLIAFVVHHEVRITAPEVMRMHRIPITFGPACDRAGLLRI